MVALVVAEHDNKQLHHATYSTITAAKELQKQIKVLVIGYHCEKVAEEAAEYQDVGEVICFDNEVYEHQLAENTAEVIAKIAKDYSHILAPATTFGKNLMPRVAALLQVGQISDITKIIDQNTFVRPIYAGNAYATVTNTDNLQIMTVRISAFEPASKANAKAPIIRNNAAIPVDKVKFIERKTQSSERPELTAAKIVISGGRGLQNAQNFVLLEEIAEQLGAAVGASRAAVDAGYVPNDYQVGQTGKVVAPDLYIAVGISGAIQHLAGMKESKVIVAINKDEDAPIFSVADYGLVADLFTVLPELKKELAKLGY